MAVPFGFSVGDFIAVVGLIAKVSKALKESGGAASEYQDVVQELDKTQHADSLQSLALNCQRPLQDFLERIDGFKASLDAKTSQGLLLRAPRKMQWGVFMASEIPKLRSVVAAKILALQLLLQLYSADFETHVQLDKVNQSIDRIQQRIKISAEAQRGSTRAVETKIHQNTEKVSFQLKMLEKCQEHYFPTLISYVKSISEIAKANVNQLQEVRDCQKRYFHQLVSAIRITHVKLDDLRSLGAQLLVASRTWPKEIRSLLRTLCETNAQICVTLMQLQRHESSPRSAPMLPEDGIQFEDALGRQKTLPYTYFRHWEVFEAMLQVDFKDLPGHEYVRRGSFHLLNNGSQQKVIKKRDWQRLVFPGTNVTMSMILLLISTIGELCPKPGCYTQGERMSSFFKCPKCNLAYTPERISIRRKSTSADIDEASSTSIEIRATSRESSSPVARNVQHRQDEPTVSRKHLRHKAQLGTRRTRLQDRARENELRELESFKRVHIAATRKQRSKSHWVARVFEQSRPATTFGDASQLLVSPRLHIGIHEYTRSVSYGRMEPQTLTNMLLEYEMVHEMVLEPGPKPFIVRLYVRPEDQNVLLFSETPDENNFSSLDCHALTSLTPRRAHVSSLELRQFDEPGIRASLQFRTHERESTPLPKKGKQRNNKTKTPELVLFHCSLYALQSQQLCGPIDRLASSRLEGEELLFDGPIIDDDYLHIRTIRRDSATGSTRLEATILGGEMDFAPVWTAFITYKMHSDPWMLRAGPNTILLTDLQMYIFTSQYRPPKGPCDEHRLSFSMPHDADVFVDTIRKLRQPPEDIPASTV